MARPVKQHLQEFHEEAAAHADRCAECFTKLAGMSKAADGGQAEQFQSLADAHTAYGEMHRAMADACEKAVQADLEKVVPDNVRGTIPTDAPARTHTAVPRFGQQQIKTNVPVELEHFLKIEE